MHKQTQLIEVNDFETQYGQDIIISSFIFHNLLHL